MGVKFDKCPICGRSVGYEDGVGDNKDLIVAMCGGGHTIIDLGEGLSGSLGGYGLARKNPWDAAKVWNKMARKYVMEHKDGV